MQHFMWFCGMLKWTDTVLWFRWNKRRVVLMISVCSKQVWAMIEPEQWRGSSPQMDPRLQTGSLMKTYKTQTHTQFSGIKLLSFAKKQKQKTFNVPVEDDEHDWAVWSDEGGGFQVCFLTGWHAHSLRPLPQELTV